MIRSRPVSVFILKIVLGVSWLFFPVRADAEPADGNSVAEESTQSLAGTGLLTMDGDIASQMIDGIDRFLLGEIDASVAKRSRRWQRNFSSAESYAASVEPNRERFKKIIGAQDQRIEFDGLEYVSTTVQPARVGEGQGFEVFAVRWPVVHGIHGEGLLLKPSRRVPLADVVVIPDADQSPEMMVGLEPGIAPESQLARRLAESGCRVVVPVLVDRADTFSVMYPDRVRYRLDAGEKTGLSHREFIYRAAFEMGRHVIGYEVQKVLAAIDWFVGSPRGRDTRVGVIGYGEGGLIALYAGAVDPRIDVTGVSGHFRSRQEVWKEPIYRNVFALLDEFGDAEIASLIAPRALVVEACRGPEVVIEPQKTRGGPGRLTTAPVGEVEREFQRAQSLVSGLKPASEQRLVVSGDGIGPFGSEPALGEFLQLLKAAAQLASLGPPPTSQRRVFNRDARMQRQVLEMSAYNQFLMRESESTRERFWARADRKSRSSERWKETVEPYRQYFYDEVIGRFDRELADPAVRTVKVFDEPKYDGYKVVMDCFPDVIAYGILLVPKGIPAGERRPVVVGQHGLEGRPRDLADPSVESPYYHQFGCRLAERGFVVYAPQNIYIFTDRFRSLQRKANSIKKTLFSIMVPQHQQVVDWLASLPMVDPERIAFYGLSYGGKTAMRVPPLVDRYCLSICSADFNEWIWKNVSTRSRYSYVRTGEYEIFEFDLGNTFNYAEMAGLIAPRPFMVERGHRDGVAPDATVAYEFARVRLLYTDLKIPERTEIEYFDGPHSIRGEGTFEFLHKHLKWPKP